MAHAVKNNSVERAAILSNDTDSVVIAAALFEKLAEEGLKELRVAFGQSGKRRWLPIHKLVEKLGAERCKGLSFFHVFTGCDMVSGFKGKGTRTFFQVWNNFSDATDAFVLLSNCPTKQALENTFATVQKFTVLAYDKSINEAKVDKVRKPQFT